MNPTKQISRFAAALAGLAGALLVFTAPAALAEPLTPRPPLPYAHWTGPVYRFPVPTVVVGGMPGWQIALIAVGAALAAATVAVLADRGWAARRKAAMSAA